MSNDAPLSGRYNRQELFNLMDQDHGISLLESEMNDIEVIIERPFRTRIKELEDDVERLVKHAAVTGADLRDSVYWNKDVNASTESWVSLPDHLQEAINAAEEELVVVAE